MRVSFLALTAPRYPAPQSNRSLMSMGGFGGSPKVGRRGHMESAVDSEISEVSELMQGDVELV